VEKYGYDHPKGSARKTRHSTEINGPKAGAPMRVKRNEPPHFAATASCVAKLAWLTIIPESWHEWSIAEYRTRFHPILAVLWGGSGS
jgi:hypothetical protein